MEKLSLHPLFAAFKRPDFYRRPVYTGIEKPEAHFFAYDEQGMYYRVHIASGETAIQIGTHWLPIAGCPFPERLVYARTMAQLARNTKQAANLIKFMLFLWALQTLIFATPGNLFGSDLAENFIQVVCAWMNVALVTIVSLAFIAIAINAFKGGLTITLPGYDNAETLALGASSFDVAPDVVVYSLSESEKPGEFARRLSEAQNDSKPGQYVVMAPFRSPMFFVVDGVNQLPVNRNKPPFDLPEFSGVSDAEFYTENYSQYSNYLSEFCKAFKVWAVSEKIRNSGAPVSTFVQNSMLSILFLLIPFFGFSQVSKQVSDYLGEARYTTEAPNKQVLFKFEKKPIYRSGDGVRSFEQLLTDVPGASFNDRADLGKLSFIKVGSEMIEPLTRPAGAAQMSSGGTLTRIESRGEMSGLQKMATGVAIIDSTTFSNGLNATSERASFYKSYFWKNYGKNAVGWMLTGFWACIVIIATPLVFFIVTGYTAKQNGYLGESGVNLQRWAARNAYKINLTLFAFALCVTASHVFFNEWHPFWALIAIILVGVLGVWWINTISPDGLNYRKSESLNRGQYGSNQPGLNG